jgi:hypothetical protein
MKHAFLSLSSLACLAAVSGVWIACTVKTVDTVPDAGTPVVVSDAGNKDAAPVKKDATVDVDAATCVRVPVAAEYDTLYKPAKPVAVGACTAAEIMAVDNVTELTATAVKAVTSPACQACLISNRADAAWGPFVLEASGSLLFNGYGQCTELATNAPCGQFVAKAQNCWTVACDKCTAPDDIDTCYADAKAGACADAGMAGTFGMCADADLMKSDDVCPDLVTTIDYLCATGPKDGG